MALARRYIGTYFVLFFCIVGTLFSQNEKIDSLKNVLIHQTGEDLAGTYLALAKEMLYVNPQQTIEYGEKALPLTKQVKNKQMESRALLTLGSGYTFMGKFKESEEYINKGLAIAEEIDNIENICAGLNGLAVINMNMGNYDKALKLFNETLAKAIEGDLTKEIAKIHFNMGAIYTNKGEWSKGLKQFTIALEYFEKEGNEQLISRTLMNIAVNYNSWGDNDLALTYYQKALDYLTQVGDVIAETSVYNNIGEIYKEGGDYDRAMDYYQKAHNLAVNIGSAMNEAVPLIGMGETYFLTGDQEKAEESTLKALELFDSIQMMEGIARSKHILGEIRLANKKYDEALKCAMESKLMAEQAGILDLQEKVYLLISKIYEAKQQLSKSFDFYKKYSAIKDTLYNEVHSKQLTQLRSELDLKEKENEIDLLQKDNEIKDIQIVRNRNHIIVLISGLLILAIIIGIVSYYNKERRKANDLLIIKNKKILDQHNELNKVNETRNMFFTIIGHDLRNPIGAFKDTLSQLADYPEMFTDEVKSQIISELREEAENTYFLLDNLLSWANAHKGSIRIKMEPFDINSTIRNCLALNSRLSENKKIKLSTDFKGNFKVVADQNMVSLILRNLISNAIKFTPEDGSVRIMVDSKNDDFVEVKVMDTGVGIPENMHSHLFDKHRHISTYGTNHEKGSGLGLMLCAEFVELNGGEISVSSVPDEGSDFSFTLKKYKA